MWKIEQVSNEEELLIFLVKEYAELNCAMADEHCGSDECYEENAKQIIDVVHKVEELTDIEINLNDLYKDILVKEYAKK